MNYYILTFNVGMAGGENKHVLYGVVTNNTNPELATAKEKIAAYLIEQNKSVIDIAFVSIIKVSSVIFEREKTRFLLVSKL